jgi:predicted metalloprotease with PDZ domain
LVNAGLPDSSPAGLSTSARLAVINWNEVVVYPAGSSPLDLRLAPSLTAPPDWKMATALPVATRAGDTTKFTPVSLETLVDSPVLIGAHLLDAPIGSADGPPHFLHIACDSPEGLKLEPALKSKFDQLVSEATALFGPRHYGSYHFLLTLSDHVDHSGLEHHESSDNRVKERTLIDAEVFRAYADLLPHEFAHSWNGKFRRPGEMVMRDLQEPQRLRLLWVYEGLTQYLGWVLAARSGFRPPEEFRDNLALAASSMQNSTGRTWRSLEDTAATISVLWWSRQDGGSRRRSYWDVYAEGALIWLEVDCLIREQTKGARSLDDFCQRFFGGRGGNPEVKPYTFDDVVADLDAVASYDWATLLRQRVSSPTAAAPLGGLERSGWRLTYAETPSKVQEARDREWLHAIDLAPSIGVLIKDDGTIVDVVPRQPAERAGVGPGMKVVAVNMRRFSPTVLRSAIAGTKDGADGLELLVENAEFFQVCKLDYVGGARFPRLERDDTRPDLLSAIIKPLTNADAGTASGTEETRP